jgi:hypothetical protein
VPESALQQIRWLHTDIFDWTPPAECFDLTATHFFLDCFTSEQLPIVVQRISDSLKHSAHWLLSDFCTPTGLVPRIRAKWILWVMYRFFVLVTRLPARNLTMPDPELAANGFTLRERRVYDWGLLHADWWQRAETPSTQ